MRFPGKFDKFVFVLVITMFLITAISFAIDKNYLAMFWTMVSAYYTSLCMSAERREYDARKDNASLCGIIDVQARVIKELAKRDEEVKDDEEGEVQTEEAEDAN